MNEDDVVVFFKDIKEGSWLSFDIETTSLDPMSCNVVGFSFSVSK